MFSKNTKIAKNTSYFTLALIGQKIISFSYFAFIAKYLGPEDLGKYYFAISFTTIFGIFMDIGLSNLLTREIARSPAPQARLDSAQNPAQTIVSSIMAVKLPLAAISALFIIWLIYFLRYPEITRYLVYMSIACVALDSFTTTYFAVSRGFHNLGFESISSLIYQFIVLSFGLAAIKYNLGLIALMLGLVLASLFNFIYSVAVLYFKYKISIWPRFEWQRMREIVIIAMPFGLFAIFQRFYTYADSVLLNFFAGDKYVGIYQIPFKLVFALQFLPMAFTASVYPAMSHYYRGDKEKLKNTFERALKYLLVISMPISFGVASIADKIIPLFSHSYSEAINPLIIIMLTLPFLFINFPIGSLLNATDRQEANTKNMGITALFAVCLNLILIPKYNVAGAAITVLLSNMLMFGLGFYHALKITELKLKDISIFFLKSIFSSLLMALAAFILKAHFNLFITIILAGIVYAAVLFFLKGINIDELKKIKMALLGNQE